MTPHIKAKKEEIAKTVIMPGDPLRAKWIAETFLEDYKLVNEVRNMFAYTGKYKNKLVTVMGHGMGNPSIGIYTHELYNFYDVENIIRVGSCGALVKDVNLGDVILESKAYSESPYAMLIGVDVVDKTNYPSAKLLELSRKTADELKIKYHEGLVICEDAFYQTLYTPKQANEKWNAIAVEMEGFALNANAQKAKKHAMTILTVSDSLVTHESMSPEKRQTTFKNMMELALNVANKL
ncbi:purine-nucleoside phosphorylase [Mycoplasmoides gallisepticum]|uniref:Uridine phosphorylase n=3 Tax=Mycoplasmoides gallisepticum TaxID=2096 RepID=Q7NAP9_MYCGA|nr:purine-nucleoside phosphorylase [Mycoplasmoides gallisepticum]AAP56936.2 Purine nucleoside phosphorylase deoD-type [Mycoplasmoides gallisepticum str. R(low)]ADC30800.1 Purine nucleoside phosphorylase deoD-type [Mycoplasmoides gallisepticum str. R(high)]AFP76156.1 Purine nucleoside phosphorylase deoD-type [Mycoplasmoides gallisepticum VA94_7994-1-7P]AFP76923.1 Purine nucleoside phosphorylase deoD-type [Mycoplasmoides gallisepticum NC95_13295-2-2P]AFP77681.1 Purine nucleoside phosphorylase de